MNKAETLKPSEGVSILPEVQPHFNLTLDRHKIDELFSQRFSELEEIKELVSLKFYYSVKEKIEKEKEAFLKLLNLESKKKDILSGYSFALDTHFFEQKFMNS